MIWLAETRRVAKCAPVQWDAYVNEISGVLNDNLELSCISPILIFEAVAPCDRYHLTALSVLTFVRAPP